MPSEIEAAYKSAEDLQDTKPQDAIGMYNTLIDSGMSSRVWWMMRIKLTVYSSFH